MQHGTTNYTARRHGQGFFCVERCPERRNEVLQYFLHSLPNCPRVHTQDTHDTIGDMQHTDDELSESEAACQLVLKLGTRHQSCILCEAARDRVLDCGVKASTHRVLRRAHADDPSQDVQAASNQVSERVLQHQLNMKDVTNSTADPDSGSDSSNRSGICSSRSSSSHSDDMENGSYARLMDMHIVVQVISSIPLIIGFTLLTFLVCVEHCSTQRGHVKPKTRSNAQSALESFCDHTHAIGEWGPWLATSKDRPTHLMQQVWLVIVTSVLLYVLALPHKSKCRTPRKFACLAQCSPARAKPHVGLGIDDVRWLYCIVPSLNWVDSIT